MADAGSAEKRSDSESPKPPQEIVSVTHGRVKIKGDDVPYTATAGTIVLYEEDSEFKQAPKAKATVFYVAYTRSDVDDQTSRPITFSFNGGPGSASVWMHLGLLGPKRVLMADETGNLPAPPFRLVENEYSLLDQSDLVFIDPISTGYSRAATGENPSQFHQFTKDIESISDFIRLYTTRAKRWLNSRLCHHQLSAKSLRHVSEWDYADLLDSRFSNRRDGPRQRYFLCGNFANLRRDCVVSQPA